MLYVLRRTRNLNNGHPAYVAYAGAEKAYTSSLQRARVFHSEAAADDEKCGNEYTVPVELNGQLKLL